MPRPKKQSLEARSVVFGVRWTPEERTSIERKAAASGLTPSDYCRAAVLGLQVQASPLSPASHPEGGQAAAPVNITQVVALNRVGVNLNQIARKLNSGLGVVPAELSDSLSRLNELLDQWQGIS